MKLSQWRSQLIQWLSGKVEVTSWYLEYPNVVGATNVFLPPLHTIRVYQGDDGSFRCTALQDFFISTRYPRDLPYYLLPLATIEGFYSSLGLMFLREYQGFTELTNAELETQGEPIKVEELGDNQSGDDWVITTKHSIKIWVPIELEVPQPDFLITGFNLGLYRADLADFGDHVKDWSYQTPTVLTNETDNGLTNENGVLLSE